MSSRIEQIIDEIEEYIDSCKFQPLSTSKIIVNKDQMDELLRELRMKTPDEIKRYQKIIRILHGADPDIVGVPCRMIQDLLRLFRSCRYDLVRLGICLLHDLMLADQFARMDLRFLDHAVCL